MKGIRIIEVKKRVWERWGISYIVDVAFHSFYSMLLSHYLWND